MLALCGATTANAVTLPPDFQESTVFEGLEFPTAVSFARDGRVFVAEKSGQILVFSNLDDSTPTLFADLSTNVYNFWDRGLLGLALDPAFPTEPYVYVSYTYDAAIGEDAPVWGTPAVLSDPCPTPPGPTDDGCVVSGRVSRLRAADDVMLPGSERVLVEDWCQQFPSHSVGDLAFGADGALFASGGEGANFFADDRGQFGDPANPCGDPPNEGGALRSQDLRTRSDALGLSGSLIRIDPETGAARPDNPLSLDPDPNARRIVAHGFRNPFRFAIRPGTNDVWVGDVGGSAVEEIDRVETPADAVVENFGWPCYEGSGPNDGFAELPLCEGLSPAAVAGPFRDYPHWDEVVPGDGCGSGTSSIAGLAFYGEGDYPGYGGALFFSDYSRRCIWAIRAGDGGLPEQGAVEPFAVDAAGPVDLEVGPGGDLYYVDFDGGTVRRIEYTGDNAAPVARIRASTTSGPVPLEVSFDATASTDADPGDTLTYAWDFDGDGLFDDSTAAQPTWTFAVRGTYTVRMRVEDEHGATASARVVVQASNSEPLPAIELPAPGARWSVGDRIQFSGSASDGEEGMLAPSHLEWTLLLHHCPGGCHVHVVEQFDGVAAGSFTVPDHSYPSHLELRLTASDSDGASATTSLELNPRTVEVTFATSPSGLLVAAADGAPAPTPFARTLIVGSSATVTAPSPQSFAATPFVFVGWSDGGDRTHVIRAPAAPATLTATFAGPAPPPSVPPTPPASPPPPAPAPPTPSAPPARSPATARCVVPSLRGRTLRNARRALVAAHCRVGRVRRAYSPRIRAGRVLSQRPRPRLRLIAGTKVNFVLSRGARRR